MIKVIVGFGLGLAAVAAFHFYAPASVKNTANAAVNVAERTVKETQQDTCKRAFLDETHCYQKQPSKTCDAEITKRCG